MKKIWMAVIAAAWCAFTLAAHAANPAGEKDNIAINKLLSNYTESVSSGNRTLFESQLLDVNIPFAAVGPKMAAASGLQSIQDYRGFRAAIFDSGTKYQQRFSNVHIEQLGNVAQVSLDYETAEQGKPYDGKGWKVMQLIKFNGQWKIVSEFFTGYPRP